MPPASVATDMSVDEPVVSGAAKALDESTNSPQNVAAPMDEDGAPVPTTGSADGHDENDQGLGHGDNSSVAWLIDPLISVAKVLSPWLPKTSL